MPYKRIGRRIYHKKGGRWKLKQTATSIKKARATMKLLYGIESGWRPTKRKYKTRVREHKRKGKKVREHNRRIKRKIKKKGFFGPSRYDDIPEEEQLVEEAIKRKGKEATEIDPEDVEIITRGVKEDFEEGINKTKGSRWKGWAEED